MWKESLDILVNIEEKAEKYISKRFGYSLLEVNGHIIWSDKKTREKLNFTEDRLKTSGVNLFNLMIPFSKDYLKKKFGGHVFPVHAGVGFTRCFSYVIYSSSSAKKLNKELKNKGYKSVDEASIVKGKNNLQKENFFRFLANISSRATLVLLSFTETEISEMLKNPMTEILDKKKRAKDQRPKEARIRGQQPALSETALNNLKSHFKEYREQQEIDGENRYFSMG